MSSSNGKLLLANLKEILRTKVKLEDQSENIKLLNIVLNKLIKQMKTDKLFLALYKDIYYTGSYYEGLRVKNATEFDLNFVLDFCKNMNFQITTKNSPPSFVTCQLTSELKDLMLKTNWNVIRDIIRTFFNSKNFLKAEKVKNWLQGIIDSSLSKLERITGVSKVKRLLSGPAITIYIITESGVQIDVDLVPVLEFKWPSWPEGAAQYFLKNISYEERYWFIVPKLPPFEICDQNYKLSHQWRLHFPGIEKKLIHNKQCLKPIIKLLKLLRDKENWRSLASYYLKTVVIWSVIIDENTDWNEYYMDDIFIKVLKQLKNFVENLNLPYLFYPEYNLICKMTTAQSKHIKLRLDKIINDIENNPDNIKLYL